jgi:hypothetical protein
MSIPVDAMHDDIREALLPTAERIIESDDTYSHPIAGRDAVRLAYILYAEAGNSDLWEEAKADWVAGG